jgi:hypothetical protein
VHRHRRPAPRPLSGELSNRLRPSGPGVVKRDFAPSDPRKQAQVQPLRRFPRRLRGEAGRSGCSVFWEAWIHDTETIWRTCYNTRMKTAAVIAEFKPFPQTGTTTCSAKSGNGSARMAD